MYNANVALVSVLVASFLVTTLPATVQAQEEQEPTGCGSFVTQAQAHNNLRKTYPDDPYGLDENGDAVACEDFPYETDMRIDEPVGGPGDTTPRDVPRTPTGPPQTPKPAGNIIEGVPPPKSEKTSDSKANGHEVENDKKLPGSGGSDGAWLLVPGIGGALLFVTFVVLLVRRITR